MAELRKPVKCTFYFDERNIAAMQRERLRRIAAGTPRLQADLSDLVNEAVQRAYRPVSRRAKGGR